MSRTKTAITQLGRWFRSTYLRVIAKISGGQTLTAAPILVRIIVHDKRLIFQRN
jgi:hypothetical protein